MGEQSNRERKRSHLIGCLATLVVVAAVLTIYFFSYFRLGGEWRPGPGPEVHPIRMRVFPSKTLAKLYSPAARVESFFRGYRIYTGDQEDLFMSSP